MASQDPLHDTHLCGGCGTEAVVRCLTCSLAGESLCADCDRKMHNVAHCHVRQHWQAGFYQNLAPHRFLVPLDGTPAANSADTVGQGTSSPADQSLAAPIVYAMQGVIKNFPDPILLVLWGNQAIALCTSFSVAILCGCTADMCLLVDDKAPSIACCCSEPCQWGEAQVGRSITCITSLGESTGSAVGQDAEQAHHLQCP
jgi:hypothetical protein